MEKFMYICPNAVVSNIQRLWVLPHLTTQTRVWYKAWWRHQMEIFSALLAICVGNSQVTGEFPTQRPVTRVFDVFLDLSLNKLMNKQWGLWWFETSCPLWRYVMSWHGFPCAYACTICTIYTHTYGSVYLLKCVCLIVSHNQAMLF